MIYRLIFLFLVSNWAVGQNSDFKPVTKERNYYSRGVFDHKTGITFVGYSRTLAYIKNHEFFVGLGTMIAMHTISTGVKFNLNIGLSVTVRTYSNERPSKINTWPQISLSKTW